VGLEVVSPRGREDRVINTILIVEPDAEASTRLASQLQAAGFAVQEARDFPSGRERLLAISPAGLVTEVHLGEFNGVHLVILGRGRFPGMAVVAIGPEDPVLASEVRRHEATYLARPVSDDEVVEHLTASLRRPRSQRRWHRKSPIAGLEAKVNDWRARVTDVSYGGLRMELRDSLPEELNDPVTVDFVGHGVSVNANLVWSRQGPAGSTLYGAALREGEHERLELWRQLVDRVESAAC